MAHPIHNKTKDLTKRFLAVTLFGIAGLTYSVPTFAEGLGWKLPSLDPAEVAAANVTQPLEAGWALPGPTKASVDASGQSKQSPADRAVGPLLKGPSLVTTAFSGHRYARPVLPEDQRQAARDNPDFQEIDLDAPVVTLSDIEGFGRAMNGDEITRAPYDQLYARQIGQVFGAVLDDEAKPNLYLSATSAFGLQIVGPDTDADLVADRLTIGDAKARWMDGQWGHAPLSGPGTIWRVDGTTGQVDIFANLSLDGKANAGSGLGNLAFDAGHDQLFASDLATGLISRLDLRGRVSDVFDHGLTARPAANLVAEAYDAATRVEITDPGFDTLDTSTWGFAPAERRIWGLTVGEGRLFYAVAAGIAARPEVWSVGLDPKTGAFLSDPRWELSLAESLQDHEISDIGFAADGGLVLAQRGPRKPAYDFSQFAEVGASEVIRYVRETPKDDPATPSVWVTEPQTHAVGFAATEANATGGLAFGPGYDAEGFLDFTQCRGTLWTTGERLRDSAGLQAETGGQMRVNGVQAQPASLIRGENTPPWVSYGHDFDRAYPEEPQQGYMGDVVVLGCDGAQLAAAEGGSGKGQCKGKSCNWLACAKDPKACKPKQNACAKTTVTLRCDTKTGTYVADLAASPLHKAKLDAVKLTDPSGKISSLPTSQALSGKLSVPLTGLVPGQIGQIALCSYDTKAAATGKPYDCCNSTVEFKLPAKACVKEIQ